MLDLQALRNDLTTVASRLATRGFVLHTARFEQLEGERKTVQTRTQELQAKRNSSSKLIGQAKAKGEDVSAIMAEVANLGDELKQLETKLETIQQDMLAFLSVIPNTPNASVPQGKSEADNVEVRKVGTPPKFDFEVKDHVSVGEAMGLDFETAAKISGSRFSLLKGPLARMHRALAQFMLDTHTDQHGYTETYVPYMVNAESLYGTGNLPKFEEDLFKVPRLMGDAGVEREGVATKSPGTPQPPLHGGNFYLIPTAEVPVTNMVRDTITPLEQLPLPIN